ncbi:MAG: hypothetical protein U0871_24275 [Gemmataceae bacterium]
MTNAQAAAHFASLPPDEEAVVVIANDDTKQVRQITLDGVTTPETLQGFEATDPSDLGKVFSFEKW